MNFKRPLVLVPDTNIQQNPTQKKASYLAPANITQESFDTMAAGVHRFSAEAGFEYINKPVYDIYHNTLFKDTHLWTTLLKNQFPIYVVTPLCGLLWPGDLGGLYDLNIIQTFWFWRHHELWKVVKDIYQGNNCDGVIAFLPNIYNNIVYTDELPWEQHEVDDIWNYTEEFLRLSRRTQTITRELPQANTITRKQRHLR